METPDEASKACNSWAETKSGQPARVVSTAARWRVWRSPMSAGLGGSGPSVPVSRTAASW
jgi:hypothetical protein